MTAIVTKCSANTRVFSYNFFFIRLLNYPGKHPNGSDEQRATVNYIMVQLAMLIAK